jgi:hypothetical protein
LNNAKQLVCALLGRGTSGFEGELNYEKMDNEGIDHYSA